MDLLCSGLNVFILTNRPDLRASLRDSILTWKIAEVGILEGRTSFRGMLMSARYWFQIFTRTSGGRRPRGKNSGSSSWSVSRVSRKASHKEPPWPAHISLTSYNSSHRFVLHYRFWTLLGRLGRKLVSACGGSAEILRENAAQRLTQGCIRLTRTKCSRHFENGLMYVEEDLLPELKKICYWRWSRDGLCWQNIIFLPLTFSACPTRIENAARLGSQILVSLVKSCKLI